MSNTPFGTFKASYVRDLAERIFWTYVQATGMLLVASGVFDVNGITDVSLWTKAGVGGIAAVLALLKGLVAKTFGNKDTAALVPGE